MDDLDRVPMKGVDWQRAAVPIGLSAVIVIAGLAYALGQRSATPPQVSPPPSPRATPTPVAPTPPAEPEPAVAAESNGDIARRISGLSGDALVGALWDLEQRTVPAPSYALLERNPDRFNGQAVIMSGEVLEIQDVPQAGGAFIRLGLGDSATHALAVFALAPPGDDIVRGRRVRVYGVLGGTFSYASQAGWEITIPRLNAVAVVRSNVPRRPASLAQ